MFDGLEIFDYKLDIQDGFPFQLFKTLIIINESRFTQKFILASGWDIELIKLAKFMKS